MSIMEYHLMTLLLTVVADNTRLQKNCGFLERHLRIMHRECDRAQSIAREAQAIARQWKQVATLMTNVE